MYFSELKEKFPSEVDELFNDEQFSSWYDLSLNEVQNIFKIFHLAKMLNKHELFNKVENIIKLFGIENPNNVGYLMNFLSYYQIKENINLQLRHSVTNDVSGLRSLFEHFFNNCYEDSYDEIWGDDEVILY
jgi:hypothetical protein|nr:MAG TPA: hypothetical protein [Caudoviricetes sp.]